ncbi:MAG: hypothetical protein HN368_13820 [Spirochaetales bacterium]|jgi:hypothetical protein|nr:hypothetical protein [Spirochaetales bacterium]
MLSSIKEMIDSLVQHSNVVGLIRYGSNRVEDDFTSGDFDLFVVLKEKDPDVESIHFYVNEIPVDLNFLTKNELENFEGMDNFHQVALDDGWVIHDPSGAVTSLLNNIRAADSCPQRVEYSDHEIAFTRHGHRHVLDKIRNRKDSMPVFCRFLLNANIYWLICSYFRVRRIHYKGEKQAISFLQKHEPGVYNLIERFYSTLEIGELMNITIDLSNSILAPVDGIWQNGEVLAFGDKSGVGLREKGMAFYRSLFAGAVL